MTNIANEVWKFLDKDPCVKRDLARGLVNIRALARYLLTEKKLDSTPDAVISAIRRYKLSKYGDIFSTAGNIVSQSTLSTRTNLANVALTKDTEVQQLLPKLFSIIHYNQGDVLRIIQADESIKVLIDEKNLGKVKELFPKSKIKKIDRNLAEINMHLHPEAVNTPGILAVTSDELAMNNVNVMETMSCVPEMLWFVKEKDVLKAHEILYGLSEHK